MQTVFSIGQAETSHYFLSDSDYHSSLRERITASSVSEDESFRLPLTIKNAERRESKKKIKGASTILHLAYGVR
jgi:hypothetical protein